MWRYPLYLFFCFYAGFCLSANLTNPHISKISDAFKNQSAQHAFELANRYFDELAGSAEFDALYGQICLSLNKIDEAVFAFERVVSERPNDFTSYYLLALSYAKQNNLNQAEQVLKTLLTLTIPLSLRNNIDETLSLIEAKRKSLDTNFKQRLSVNVGHDSNVNSGSLDDRVVVSGIEILLDEQSLETSDQYVRMSYDFSGSWQSTQHDGWHLDLNLAQQTHKRLSQYNRTHGNLSFGYEFSNLPYRFNVIGIASLMALDEATYQQELGLVTSAQFYFTKNWAFDTQARVSVINNVENENLDSELYDLSLGISYIDKDLLSKIAFNYGKQNADLFIAEHFGRDSKALSLSVLYNLTSFHSFAFNAQYKDIKHHKIHPFFLMLREEQLKNIAIEWRYKLSNHWRLHTRYSVYDKSSTLPIYEFDRNEWYLGASYDF